MRKKIKIEYIAGDVKHVRLRLVKRIAVGGKTLAFLSHERNKRHETRTV